MRHHLLAINRHSDDNNKAKYIFWLLAILNQNDIFDMAKETLYYIVVCSPCPNHTRQHWSMQWLCATSPITDMNMPGNASMSKMRIENSIKIYRRPLFTAIPNARRYKLTISTKHATLTDMYTKMTFKTKAKNSKFLAFIIYVMVMSQCHLSFINCFGLKYFDTT